MKSNERRTSMNYGLMALLGLIGILAVGSLTARASGLSDVPTSLGDALGVSASTAGIILTSVMVIAMALIMATSKQPVLPTSISLIAVIGLATALSWVGFWLLILAALAFVTLFTSKIVNTVTGKGGE